uniref:Uncharacterized protein n=1 Tax=viral metagenome TaxID=1070528 RepID=A0A6M3K7X2_9ZZZZ
MKRPEIEEWDVNKDPVPNYNPSSELITLGNRYKAVRDYALDQERKNAAYDKANKDFQESLITANKERAILESRLKWAEDLLKSTLDKLYRLDFSKGSRLSILIDDLEEALKGLGKEDRVTDSIDPVVRSLRHAEEIIAQGPNGLAWPDISSHQIKAEKE